MIIFYILTTLSLDNVWTLLGENCCWSLLGLKGLTHSSVRKLKGLHLHITKIRCVLLSVPDPDLQMGGGSRSQNFSALWASVWYKIKLVSWGGGGGGAPLDRALAVLGKVCAEVIT